MRSTMLPEAHIYNQKRDTSWQTWLTIIAMIGSGLTYVCIGFSYAHSTFLTRAEADTRAHSRDTNEERIVQTLIHIEEKVDRIIEKQNEHK